MRFVEKREPQLYKEGPLDTFFSIPPLDPDGEKKARELLRGREFQRTALADCLEGYNREIGNDAAAFLQIGRFREELSVCVLTGQQLGFCGGPSYTILKAVSCLILAKKFHAVPIFWLATEDHDADEIDHTYLIDQLGNLNRFYLSFPKEGRFIEDLTLNDDNQQEIRRFFQAIDRLDLAQLLSQETSYARAMAKVMVQLFKGTGLVFVEPYLLRPFAKTFFQKELAEHQEVSKALQKTTAQLLSAGGTAPFDAAEGTHLFMKMQGGVRVKIRPEGNGFRVGREVFDKGRMLDLVENEPQRLSTNAAARCVLQNMLFPVLAYAAGPGELAYYHQLKGYHAYHGIAMPWIVPRLSASIVTPSAQKMLESLKMEAWENIPESWPNAISDLERHAKDLDREWIQSASRHFGKDLAVESMSRFIHFQAQKLKKKAIHSRLKQKGIAPHALHYLKNFLRPRGAMQERVINWWEFQTHADFSLIGELFKHLDEIPRGHLYCYL